MDDIVPVLGFFSIGMFIEFGDDLSDPVRIERQWDHGIRPIEQIPICLILGYLPDQDASRRDPFEIPVSNLDLITPDLR
jgi:hypothetical protein